MPKKYQSGGASEWSALVEVAKLPASPKIYHIEADEQERIDLARRMAILSVEKAEADITLQRSSGGVVPAIGSLRAVVTQACVVSLAPVEQSIVEQFEGWFGSDSSAVSFARAKNERDAKKSGMESEILEESVDPEPIVNGMVDIGELTAQNLSLLLDPYPHAPGVKYELGVDSHEEEPEGANLRKNPFEALKDWKEKR
jgi:hypothetical protein